MSEWWVDPDNGLTTNDGTSSSTPWKLIPGQTGASSQTGYTVTGGDTINIKNGSTTTLAIAAPADNLTYRGYGIASNVLVVKQPIGLGFQEVKVVRSPGTHEGMWIVDANGASPFSMVASGTRSGCIFEDFHIKAPLVSTPLSLGTSGSTAIGVTARRFKVSGAEDTGVSAYTREVLLEDFVLEEIEDDGITIGASAVNSYRVGYKDIIRRCAIINPGTDNAAFLGDAIQVFPSSDRFESHLTIEDVYVYKNNNTKQGIVLADMLAGFILRRFYFDGPSTATTQILMSGLRGAGYIGQGVFAGGCASHPAIRFSAQSGVGMATGSSLIIESVLLTASSNNGLFSWTSGTTSYTVDGTVEIRNCYTGGVNENTLSYAGTITAHPSTVVTLGGNQSITVSNTIIETTGQYAFRMPTGTGGSGLYVFQNNLVDTGLTFAIGSTAYADLAAFEAAHASGNNVQDDPTLDSNYRPKTGSPAIGAGTYIKNARHMGGMPMNVSSPDIGAYRYLDPRKKVLTRAT